MNAGLQPLTPLRLSSPPSIIIYLIAFEVCLALISHEYVPSPKRIWNLLTGVAEANKAQQEAPDMTDEAEKKIVSSLRRLLAHGDSPPPTTQTRLV